MFDDGIWSGRNGKGMVWSESWSSEAQYINPMSDKVRRKRERNLREGRGGRNDILWVKEVAVKVVDW